MKGAIISWAGSIIKWPCAVTDNFMRTTRCKLSLIFHTLVVRQDRLEYQFPHQNNRMNYRVIRMKVRQNEFLLSDCISDNNKKQRTIGPVKNPVQISSYWGKRSLKILHMGGLEQSQWITLIFGTQSFMYSFRWLHLPTFISYHSFWKIRCFNFFLNKSIGDQIWPCRKIDQGQPRDIIWTNLVVLEYSMLHTKVIRLSVPEEKIFKDFNHILAWRTSWPCDLDHLNKSPPPHPKEAPRKIWL